MITYNDIYEALRKEKYAETLQPLDKKFIYDVAEYLKDKQEAADKKDELFSDAIIKTKKQLENAVSLFKELILRRKKKLLTLAFIARETGISKRDFENMFDFEREMFERVVKSMEESDKNLADLLNGKIEDKNILVSFKEKVDQFLDLSGEMIGPFDKGEIANLPEEIVKILSSSGKAEIIED